MTYIDQLDIACRRCDATYVYGETHHCRGHSYWDEMPPARPVIEPTRVTWRDVAEIIGGMVVFGTLFLGLPFLLWLVAA